MLLAQLTAFQVQEIVKYYVCVQWAIKIFTYYPEIIFEKKKIWIKRNLLPLKLKILNNYILRPKNASELYSDYKHFSIGYI